MVNGDVNSGSERIEALYEKIRKRADHYREDMAHSLSDIVKIPSVSPKFPGENYDEHLGFEGDVARYMGEIYETAGASVDYWEVEEKRTNVAARLKGAGEGLSLIYNGHTDVVPPGRDEAWRGGQPYSGEYDGEYVWGRGSTDMKAGLISQAFALKILHDLGVKLNGDLILQACVGEETMDHETGTGSAFERGYKADAAVVAEPSSPSALVISPDSAGMWWFEIEIVGKRTHSSMRGESIHAGGRGPAVGVNAIDKAFIVYEALRRLERDWVFTKTHENYPAGHFTILPGTIYGGPSVGERVPFQLSDITIIDYLTWYPPDADPEEIKREIEEFVHNVAQTDAWLRENPPIIRWKQNWRANNPEESAKSIIEATQHAHQLAAIGGPHEEIGGETAGFLAVCDGTFLTEQGIPSIVYGPGDIGVAHADDEYASIDEVVTAAKTFAILAIEWCGLNTWDANK